MFIRGTKKAVKGKTYVNHLESVSIPKGPRNQVICSLGSLEPGPREQWRAMAHKMAQALGPQHDLFAQDSVADLLHQARCNICLGQVQSVHRETTQPRLLNADFGE
jgi:hypothetical protein